MDSFNKSDLEKILFITRFIKPISVWDSEYHKTEIEYLNPNNVDDDGQKKASIVTKDIIESLLGVIPKNKEEDKKIDSSLKINSIIINSNDSTMPAFLKTINDLIEMTWRE